MPRLLGLAAKTDTLRLPLSFTATTTMTAPLTMRLPSRKAGVWVQVFETLAEKSPDSMQFIDSSIIRAHQQAAVQSGVMLLTLAG